MLLEMVLPFVLAPPLSSAHNWPGPNASGVQRGATPRRLFILTLSSEFFSLPVDSIRHLHRGLVHAPINVRVFLVMRLVFVWIGCRCTNERWLHHGAT